MWLGVLVCLLGTEITLRVWESKLSIDIAHIRGAPQTAEKIAEGDLQDRTQVLFIGNSLTRAGIDPDLLPSRLGGSGDREIDFHFFYPDGGNIGAWRMAWDRYFEGQFSKPDLVLLCGGRSHFRDAALDPVTAGAYYLSWRQLPSVLFNEYSRFDDRVRLVGSRVSIGFANRRRVQRRVRDMILPHNRAVLWDMANRQSGNEVGNSSSETSHSLVALLETLDNSDVETAVVLMPSYRDYEMPPERKELLKSHGAHLIDLKSPAGIESRHFYDQAHLDEEGAEILTKKLVDRIRPLLESVAYKPVEEGQ